MRQSSIRYRVADFLKQHSPFDAMSEDDLLGLTQRGRVKFHEGGERVYGQGAPHGPFLFVIQQGGVECRVEDDSGERVRDLLGAGDLLGLDRFVDADAHLHSAITVGDVILYSIGFDDFEAQMRKHAAVSRYVAAYVSVDPHHAVASKGSGTREASEASSADAIRSIAIPACPREIALPIDATLVEVVRAMQRESVDSLAIVGEKGEPVGFVSGRDLLDALARKRDPRGVAAGKIMHRGFATSDGRGSARSEQRAMLESGQPWVAITKDGTAVSPLVGVRRALDVRLALAPNPLDCRRALLASRTEDDLRRAWECVETERLAELSSPEALDGCACTATELFSVTFRKAVALAQSDLAETLPNHSWLFFGSAGRGELLTRFGLATGIVFQSDEDGDAASDREALLGVAGRVHEVLTTCGFRFSVIAPTADDSRWCQSLDDWKANYTDWIRSPILSHAYSALPLFDARLGDGDSTLFSQLAEHIRTEVASDANFVPLMANDSLANLPPMTFYQGLVVQDDGEQTEVLDLWESVLQPLVDVGRVLALDLGASRAASSVERLAEASRSIPVAERILDDAQEAFRFALYIQSTRGLRSGDAGNRVFPRDLEKTDQQRMKSAFRSILALLEFTAERYGLTPRRQS